MKKLMAVLLCLCLLVTAAYASSEGPHTPAPGEPMEGPSASGGPAATVPPAAEPMEAAESIETAEPVETSPAAGIDVLTVIALGVTAAAVILTVTAAVLVIKTKKNG